MAGERDYADALAVLSEHDDPLIGPLLRRLHRHWSEAVDEALRDAGFGDIHPPHINAFRLVPEAGINLSELARRAGVRKQSMADAIDQLERAGYVERRPDPDDGRARLVLLTERGKAVRPIGAGAGRHVEEQWARLTSDSELESLRGLLQSLLEALAVEAPGI